MRTSISILLITASLVSCCQRGIDMPPGLAISAPSIPPEPPISDIGIDSGTSVLTLTGFTNTGGILSATGTGDRSKKAAYNVNTVIEECLFTYDIKVMSSTCTFGVGKDPGTSIAGTLVEIGTDNYIHFYQWNNTTFTLAKSTLITGLTISNGNTYTVTYRKSKFVITVTVSDGTNEFTATHDWPTDATFAGSQWGKPTALAITGSIEVSDFWFGSNFIDANWAIWGDSFTECNSLQVSDQIDQRWLQTLIDTVGSVAIFGRGGEYASTIVDRFSTELSWTNPTYVILALGTNTNAIATYETRMNAMITEVEAAGAIPILTTVVNTSQQANIDDINAWIRARGKRYIEFANAITTDSNNDTWKPGYVLPDGIHPTVTGHAAMATQMLSDLSDIL